jgi:hypothetical protein
MGILLVLMALVALLAIIGTAIMIRRDGLGHTPPVLSDYSWSAGKLPSESYSAGAFRALPRTTGA